MPSSHCQYKRLSEVDAETIQRMGWAETEKRLRLTRQHPSVFPPPVTPAEGGLSGASPRYSKQGAALQPSVVIPPAPPAGVVIRGEVL